MGAWEMDKPECLSAGPDLSVGALVDRVEDALPRSKRVGLRHVWAEEVHVAACTWTLLRRDPVAVAVVYDDVLGKCTSVLICTLG